MSVQKYTQYQLDEVKAAFTGEDAVAMYGIQKKGHSILCPNPDHHDKHFGSCNVTRQGDYHCFVCRKTWSGIDFVQFLEGLKFIEAVEKAASFGGVILNPCYSWLEERNQWLIANGKKEKESSPSVRIYPRLSKEDAALIGIPYGSGRILAPVNCSDDCSIRNERGIYRESDITGKLPDLEDEDASDLFLKCISLPNPAYYLPQEDPEAYAWLVTNHIDAKLQFLRKSAVRFALDNMPEVISEIDRLYRHLKELRLVYEPYLQHTDRLLTAAV